MITITMSRVNFTRKAEDWIILCDHVMTTSLSPEGYYVDQYERISKVLREMRDALNTYSHYLFETVAISNEDVCLLSALDQMYYVDEDKNVHVSRTS